AAFARCLGMQPRDLARQMAEQDLRRAGEVAYYTPERDQPGRYRPEIQTGAEVDAYRDGYRRLWEVKDLSAVRELYFAGAAVAIPGGDTRYGHDDIDRF